jgi:hypothetical protein
MKTRIVLLTVFTVLFVIDGFAQQKFDFYARGPYRQNVPRPSSITGYEAGQFQTPYGQVVRVVEKIAAASDRVRLIENGETWEYRKIYLAVVSAPENLARLDEIKSNIAKLADPRKIANQSEVDQIARSTPNVVWLNYGIHGNESASYEAIQQTLYQLAASEEPRTLEILRNNVIVINIMHNPDGHERFAVWENSVAIGNAENFSIEHSEPYQIYGRVNHYRFDLNRDLLAMSQAESIALIRGVRDWRPQLFIDHHGQVSSYFFPPAAEPINKNLPVEKSKFWYDKYGRGNAAAFDKYGWNYYVRHVFDVFYAGYMDSWSSLNGATGMTYETDAGGPTSINSKLDDDTILTFRQGIAKHFTATMASLETATDNREARLKDYYQFFKTGMDEVRSDKIKRVVIVPNRDPGRAAQLVRNLVREGIEVTITREGFKSTSVHDYSDSKAVSKDFPAGAYVIDFNQPQKRLAKAHLEPNSELDESFVKQELARRERNEKRGKNESKEGYEFYDMTTWSLPLAFGVEAYWTEDTSTVRGAQVTLKEESGSIQQWNVLNLSALAASDGQPLPGLVGNIEGGRANTAYIIPYGTDAASRMTITLLAEGFKVAVTTRQLNAGGRNWPAGTLIARTHRNPETLHTRINELARETGTQVYAISSSFSEEGDTGIGSENIASLKEPKVLVVWDEATSVTSYGAMWYTFERAYGLKFTPVAINTLKGIDLAKFNVIILPDGSAGAYQNALDKSGIDKLKTWVNGGGVLIGIGGAAVMFTRKDVEITSSRIVGSDDDSAPQPEAEKKEEDKSKDKDKEEKKEAKPAEKPDEKKKPTEPIAVPGAAFRAKVSRDHFLSFGYPSDTVVAFFGGDTFFRASKDGANVVTFAPEGQLTISGFVWPDNTEALLRGTSYLIDEPTGAGHVIMFGDDPNLRFLWRSTSQFFLNAILLAPSIR